MTFGVPATRPPGFAVARVRTKEPVVALTFDACATKTQANGFDREVFEILRRERVPVTMFLTGRWIQAHPEAAGELAAQPWIELGNHSYSHPGMTRVSPRNARGQLGSTQRLIARLGRRSTLYRPPGGAWDPASARLAARQQLTTVAWDVASGDAGGRMSPRRIVAGVLAAVRPGSIVVFHINRRAPHTRTALPEIIARLRQRGLRFATVSELLALPDAELVAAKPMPFGYRMRRRPVPLAQGAGQP